jgi:hypothetical protein
MNCSLRDLHTTPPSVRLAQQQWAAKYQPRALFHLIVEIEDGLHRVDGLRDALRQDCQLLCHRRMGILDILTGFSILLSNVVCFVSHGAFSSILSATRRGTVRARAL